ncbi:MAG: crosslink repair DNA glycosylase YcaQ family protein [Ktedonobacteraceae bacterium]
MTIQLSCEQARHLLAGYHFTPTDLLGVFTRLGTVQYDPLNPVGRNPDLVLQARVPGYRVDDWQALAYGEQRLIYDAWDKQACLVPIGDWARRALIRERYRAYHDREILLTEPEAVEAVLAALDARGPLSSLEFERKTGYDPNSWAGSTQAKRILRSLWVNGEVVTHHRRGGRHYYDRASRVIPAEHFEQPPLLDEAAYRRWIIARRYQATGLLRPNAESAIWSACGEAAQRKQAQYELIEEGTLTPVQIDTSKHTYYAYTAALKQLDAPSLEPHVIFLAPLDSLLWDRKGVQQIFNFDYLWEVYKPEHLRKWGYYVLPVWYGERFIARLDSRLEKGVWTISHWWWEPDITPDEYLLDALRTAIERFMTYLGANSVRAGESVDECVRKMVANY